MDFNDVYICVLFLMTFLANVIIKVMQSDVEIEVSMHLPGLHVGMGTFEEIRNLTLLIFGT